MRLYISGETKDGKYFKVQNEALEEKVIEKEKLKEFIRQGKVEVVNYNSETGEIEKAVLSKRFMEQVTNEVVEHKIIKRIVIERLPWTSNLDSKRSKLKMIGNSIIVEKEDLIAYHSDNETVKIESNKNIVADTNSESLFNFTFIWSMLDEDGCRVHLKELEISEVDTSNVTDMSGMFYNIGIENLDLSSFDTSKVTNMSRMFCNVETANLDLSSFDTSNVTNMHRMFAGVKIKNLDISSFDIASTVNVYAMFTVAKIGELKVKCTENKSFNEQVQRLKKRGTNVIWA